MGRAHAIIHGGLSIQRSAIGGSPVTSSRKSVRLISPELEAELHGSQTAKVELAAYTYAPNGWSDYDIIWNYSKLELEVSLR